MAANHRQLLPIKRPVEIVNVFGSEISNLPALGAVLRLQPQVVHTIVADGIHDSLSVARNRNSPNRGRSNSITFAALPPDISRSASISLCSPECCSVGNAAIWPSGERSKMPETGKSERICAAPPSIETRASFPSSFSSM